MLPRIGYLLIIWKLMLCCYICVSAANSEINIRQGMFCSSHPLSPPFVCETLLHLFYIYYFTSASNFSEIFIHFHFDIIRYMLQRQTSPDFIYYLFTFARYSLLNGYVPHRFASISTRWPFRK